MNTDIVTRCQPIRAARKPFQCRLGQRGFRGPCWVTHPYDAVRSQAGMTCNGCGGAIDPNRLGPPSPKELSAVGISR